MSGYKEVPTFIRDQIRGSASTNFRVGKSRDYSRADIGSGALNHLGVTWDHHGLKCPSEPVIPPPGQGRWSKYNVEGRAVIRRDLPKVEKTVSAWSTPNFGDPNRGYHTYYSVRKVYQRETWYNQRFAIDIAAGEPTSDRVRLGFFVDRVFDRDDLAERDLLMACSLLRENVGGHVSIVPTDIPAADWLRQQKIDWEFLPVGEREPLTFAEVARRLQIDPSTTRARRMSERYDLAFAMKPKKVVVGAGEFSRYFGFQFRDNLMALECLDYGNALYLMYDDWRELSQRTRIDLLADSGARYDRVIHRPGWEGRLAGLLRAKGHNFGEPSD
ncbi:hypothetical protein [Mycolicibacterium wolinskyi]|uniref:hypothetical protein n=1 Tax=Mycolicibacterium wolinskyi TaxID=59750 RepID=UPI0039177B9C